MKVLANIKSAIKRARQTEKRRAQNATQKSALRTAIKKYEALVEQKNVEGAKQALSVATKKLDKAVSKGLIHKNEAARRKSRLMKMFNEIQGATA